ncbi:MAG: hypothetical protein GY722_21865 [bacterium]|nr:hypothetical protein [bacterium]
MALLEKYGRSASAGVFNDWKEFKEWLSGRAERLDPTTRSRLFTSSMVEAQHPTEPLDALDSYPICPNWAILPRILFGRESGHYAIADLRRKLMRYIRRYNKAPKPIKWMYRDTTNRFAAGAKSVGTGH